MKYLITGNMGYLGSVVTSNFKKNYNNCEIIGVDSGFFAQCTLDRFLLPESHVNNQFFSDVRNFPLESLKEVDSVIHLAAISNDPMGNEFEILTNDINYKSTIEIAKNAKKAGVKNFVFASSCSVYGFASQSSKTEEDSINPLTAYAKSKIDAERDLLELADENFTITCLRFATACGYSPRLRLDLVLNDFVASALSSGKINILSDGSPWRPLIDVNDMFRAIDWASKRKANSHNNFYLLVNIGSNNFNYTVLEIAQEVQKKLPNTIIEINKNAPPDKRSYKVDFTLFSELAKDYQPLCNLEQSINNLIIGLNNIKFNDKLFRESYLIRLNHLKSLKNLNLIDENLYLKN
jgi:nucleoside-diphosphate-sugar epimerase